MRVGPFWLDELPSQAVLDGIERLPFSFSSTLEPAVIFYDRVLPTYVDPLQAACNAMFELLERCRTL